MNLLNKLFLEFEDNLMNNSKPSSYFKDIIENELVIENYPFTLFVEEAKTEQSPMHHSEGNVWKHTLLVVDNAATRKEHSKDPRAFMWAALLHDIGKPSTTRLRKGKYTAYDHDKVGEGLTIDFLKVFNEEEDFIYRVSKLVKWHMQILFVAKDMPFADIENMVKEVSVEEIALLSLCDRLGRGGMTKEKEQEEKENVRIFLKKINMYLNKNKLVLR